MAGANVFLPEQGPVRVLRVTTPLIVKAAFIPEGSGGVYLVDESLSDQEAAAAVVAAALARFEAYWRAKQA